MDTRPAPLPEGKLIGDAAARHGLSLREAARRAGISYGRWRQIVTGYQNVSPGEFAAVHAPARTLAKMAQVVGVTPEQLAKAGRTDAAEAMQDSHNGTTTGRFRLIPGDSGAFRDQGVNARALELVAGVLRPDAAGLRAAISAAGPGATGDDIFDDAALARIWDLVLEGAVSEAYGLSMMSVYLLRRRSEAETVHQAG